MTLSSEQVKRICDHVNQYITISTLRDDMVDHVCCIIERLMAGGSTFEESMQQAMMEVTPGSLNEIQRETNYLLNIRDKIPMKKLTYLIGSLSAMAISFGWLLRTLHLGELGNAVFAFGALGFVAVFLPLLGINYFKDNTDKSMPEKLRFVLGILSGIFIGLAFLAKIMHMPGADQVLWAGGILFTFGFLPFLFFNLYKKSIS
jgi:hypothetical protein